jgi:hypothetical protein
MPLTLAFVEPDECIVFARPAGNRVQFSGSGIIRFCRKKFERRFAAGAEFAIDMLQMPAHRVAGQTAAIGDFLVGKAFRQ